jgi:ATP-dependent DNA helicase PIF1
LLYLFKERNLIIQKQQEAIQAAKDGENIALIAPAGCGKSWCIEQINEHHNTVLTSSTGISAVNINGITAHKAFSLPLGFPTEKDWTKITPAVKDVFGLNSPVKRIVIDEVGMFPAYQLDVINLKLQKLRNNSKPFGGLQMILSGDPSQLAPIIGRDEEQIVKARYKSPFIFDADSFKHIKVMELTEVVRQSDKYQIGLLQNIRRGIEVKDTLEAITALTKPYINCAETIHLCCYNADADNINDYWYSTLSGNEKVYRAMGEDKTNPTPQILKLKLGTKVLICANDPEGAYVNGDRGTVIGMGSGYVTIECTDGKVVDVTPFKWEKYQLKATPKGLVRSIISVFEQIPLRLGWAVSIHKSQSLTLDNVSIDIGKGCFSHGQLYTALSRVRNLNNLSFVRHVSPKNVILNPAVDAFYKSLGDI